jgi:LPXTG-motif cell wall-anchored protein
MARVTEEQLATYVQQMPTLAQGVREVGDQLAAQEREVRALRESGQAVPGEVDAKLKALRGAVVKMRTSYGTLLDQWRAALQELRQTGQLTAADWARFQESQLTGLGVLFVIGWPLAIAIAAVLAPAAFVAAYSLTAGARAEANATALESKTLIDAWKARVKREDDTGIPAIELPKLPGPTTKPTTGSKVTTAIAGAGAGVLLVSAVLLFFLMKGKRNGKA